MACFELTQESVLATNYSLGMGHTAPNNLKSRRELLVDKATFWACVFLLLPAIAI